MIQFGASRCPSGALLCLGGRLRTLGSLLFALVVQGTAGAASEGSSTGILNLIARSTAISLAVLLSHVRGGWQAVDVVPGGSVRAR